jgi:2-hydroxy-6-oxonona-2,4-dienedioate hydrolase
METSPPRREATLQIGGRAARVHLLGPEAPGTPAMVLLHGAWGGAELHWGAIWDRLAERYRVVAPELPGFGHGDEGDPRTVPELATWLGQVLTAVGVERAWIVGSAFGGAVGWQLARWSPERANGLVLINGGPPPAPTRLLRAFFKLGVARRFIRHAIKNGLFAPSAIRRGFADPSRAPEALTTLLAETDPPQLRSLVEAIVRGGIALQGPAVPVLMLWGEADQLPGTDGGILERLRESGIEPSFESLPGAGHLPQLEKPEEVVARIVAFAVT